MMDRQIMNTQTDSTPTAPARRLSPWLVALIFLLAVLLSAGIAVWVVTTILFPSEFRPVSLNPQEAQVLTQKLERLDTLQRREPTAPTEPARRLQAEPYSEEGASREIVFSEKELNALLANNTELARRLAINLSDDLASARLLVPLDPDFPLLGGQTLRLDAGVEMRYADGRPVIILKGVSLWGVPMPNAWLGNLKHIDLVQAYGQDSGFWQAFAEGVEEISVQRGELRIRLKE